LRLSENRPNLFESAEREQIIQNSLSFGVGRLDFVVDVP